jgi:hypothetical protein
MMRRITLALLLCLARPVAAQEANPEIYLAPLRYVGDSIVVGTPVNVTRRAGYDNQPAFTADSRSVLFTAQSDGQNDIWRYDIATRRTVRLTRTPESEYSPTPIPGEARFSVVRVERDSTQRLWSFGLTGGAPRLELPGLKPVGYHGWLGANRLAAFVLGSPSTLHVVRRDGSGDTVIARNIGRAIQPLPAGSAVQFTFTQRDSANVLRIMAFTGRTTTAQFGRKTVTVRRPGTALESQDVATRVDSTVTLLEPPFAYIEAAADNEFHTWTADNTLITASNGVLLRWNAVLGAGSAWLPLADLRRHGVKNVSRLAASPDGAWLAFVAEPAR